MKNRELKFRIWSGIKRDWLNSCVIGDNGIPLLLYVEVNDDKNIHNRVYTIENLNPVIQQYTGLLDKSGKEIYEGDIIETHIFDGETLSEYKYVLMVYWDDLFNQWWAKDKNLDPYLCQRFPFYGGRYEILLEKTEIVGNIFENKDLLKSSILEN